MSEPAPPTASSDMSAIIGDRRDSDELILEIKDASALTHSGRYIFRNLSLSLRKGDVIGITGPSGCGKSTLLSWVAGVQPAAAVAVLAQKFVRQADTLGASRPKFGFVPQGANHLFVSEFAVNTTIRLIRDSLTPQQRCRYEAKLTALLSNLALDEHRVRALPIRALSGGEAQRFALAITLARQSVFWIADEPTASLDEANKSRLVNYLTQVRDDRKTTMLLASHDRGFLASACDKVYVLGPDGLAADVGASPFRPSSTPKVGHEAKVLSVREVSYSFKSGDGRSREIIRRFSHEYTESTVYGIVGRSGSGKSTLLRILAGFESPSRGRVVRLDGRDRGRPPTLLVPQDARLFFNPRQNVLSHARTLSSGLSNPPTTDALVQRIRTLGLQDSLLSATASTPSGGEVQRLALAVSLWLEPKLLCLDEIDSALDVANKSLAAEQIVVFARTARSAVILATHDLDFARSTCDHILQLDGNEVFPGL